jgi:hypothetical protein
MPGKVVDPLERVRAVCIALPEVSERLSHGAPTWFVRDKSAFVNFWVDGHHDHQFPHLTLAAAAGIQAELMAVDPDRYFRPPYVGHRGWVGVRMDGDVNWPEVTELCTDAYRTVAPSRLIRILDTRPS